ncbi:J domain-containing protein [Serratia fonticola]
MNIWHILSIARTQDIRAIKRAYAARAKQCHPDDAPEQFLQLRSAYEQALEFAQDNKATSQRISRFSPLPEKGMQRQFFQLETPPLITFSDRITTRSDESGILSENAEQPDFESIFRQVEQNRLELMLEKGVLRTLLITLADSKQRNNKQVWHDFIFSDEFLQAQLNDDFLQLLVYCLTQKSGVPADKLPRNMYIYLLLAFNAVTGENNTDISHIVPLVELIQLHPHYTYIEKDIRRKEFVFIRECFALYHDVLRLHARSRLQSMVSQWHNLLNRLESNYHTRGRSEIYLLLTFFIRCNPDLPDYVYKIMYKVFDLAGYHQSSRKQALKPLYEILHENRSDLVEDIIQEQHLTSSMKRLFSSFQSVFLKYKNSGDEFYFEMAVLPEVEQLFTSKTFLIVQFEPKVLSYFKDFFSARSNYVALGISVALLRAYQQHADKKDVSELLQSITQYLARAQSERDANAEDNTDKNIQAEIEEEQVEACFTDGSIDLLSLTEESELDASFEDEEQWPLPEDGIIRTLLDALADEKLRDNKEFWHDFILSELFLSRYHGDEFLAEIVYWLKRQTALPIRKLPRNMYLFLNVAFFPQPHSFTLVGYSEGIHSQPDFTLLKRLMKLHDEYHLFESDLKQTDLEELHKAFYIYNSAQTLHLEQGFTPFDIWGRLFDSVCGSEDCLCNAYLFRVLPTFIRLHPEMPVGIYKIMHKKYKLECYHTSRRKHILKDLYECLEGYRQFYVSDAERKNIEMLKKQYKNNFRKELNSIYKSETTISKDDSSQVLTQDGIDALFGSEIFRSIQFDSEIISCLISYFSKGRLCETHRLWSVVYNVYKPYDKNQEVSYLLNMLKT